MARLDEQLDALGKEAYRFRFVQGTSEERVLNKLIHRWRDRGETPESSRTALEAAKRCRRRQFEIGELSLGVYVAYVLDSPLDHRWDFTWLGPALLVGAFAGSYGFAWLIRGWAYDWWAAYASALRSAPCWPPTLPAGRSGSCAAGGTAATELCRSAQGWNMVISGRLKPGRSVEISRVEDPAMNCTGALVW